VELPKSLQGIGIIVSNWAVIALLAAAVIICCLTRTGPLRKVEYGEGNAQFDPPAEASEDTGGPVAAANWVN
jgi:hypothetical protein